MSAPLRVGVVGLGYWGPNLARNFHSLPRAELVWCCDASEAARERIAPMVPGTRMTDRLEELHLSWLDPHKERRFTIVGSKRMATFDEPQRPASGARAGAASGGARTQPAHRRGRVAVDRLQRDRSQVSSVARHLTPFASVLDQVLLSLWTTFQ